MTRARIPIPQEEIADFCLRNQIRSLALFGSVINDDFGPDSAVGMLALGRMQRELSTMLARPVDLVPPQGLKPRIRAILLSSSEEFYAR